MNNHVKICGHFIDFMAFIVDILLRIEEGGFRTILGVL